MKAVEQPPYVSRRTPASLGQECRIYADQLKLRAWVLFHTVVIPVNEIVGIEVRPSIFGEARGFTWGIKLDMTDLHRHVLVRRKTGCFQRFAFTPDNPDEFARICDSALTGG